LAYCRQKGLYPNQVQEWREACLHGVESPSVDPKVIRSEVRDLKQDKKSLERELLRKDKALAEAAALNPIDEAVTSVNSWEHTIFSAHS